MDIDAILKVSSENGAAVLGWCIVHVPLQRLGRSQRDRGREQVGKVRTYSARAVRFPMGTGPPRVDNLSIAQFNGNWLG